MTIYDLATRYDVVTGKAHQRWVEKEIRCDYTGKVLKGDSDPDYYCSYQLDYEDMDPCFSEDGPIHDGLDTYTFLSQTYHFWSAAGSDEPDEYAEALMFKEAMAGWTNRESEWYRCFTFDAMCRKARVRTAKRLIQEGVIRPEQLVKQRW